MDQLCGQPGSKAIAGTGYLGAAVEAGPPGGMPGAVENTYGTNGRLGRGTTNVNAGRRWTTLGSILTLVALAALVSIWFGRTGGD